VTDRCQDLLAMVHALSSLAILCVALLAAGVVMGCGQSHGSGLPVTGADDDVVVTVGSAKITRREVEHLIATQTGPGLLATLGGVPSPPTFTACVARLQHSQEGRSVTSRKPASVLRENCSFTFGALSRSALRYLITAKWTEGEARELEVKVTAATINAALARVGPGSGSPFETRKDRVLRARQIALEAGVANALAALTSKSQGREGSPVTRSSLARYYAAHRARYGRLTMAEVEARVEHDMLTDERQIRELQLGMVYDQRWRRRTTCHKPFVIEECARTGG
jgi:hypothetical protein